MAETQDAPKHATSFRNTICCPGCTGILRVSAQVVSDGKVYQYYLCSKCVDLVRQDPATGNWELQKAVVPQVPDVVRLLTAFAVEDWRSRSTSRAPLVQGKAPPPIEQRQGPPAGMGIVHTRAAAALPEKVRPGIRTVVERA